MVGILGKIIGGSDERGVKKFRSTVEKTNALEPDLERLTQEGLRAKSDELKGKLEAGQDLDDLLPEAFALVREAAKRQLGQRHYDVQLMGGIVLHQGKIAEMKTGEGKTLVSTLPIYLNALMGRGVHAVTVNDYLARRDPVWMGPIYHALGLSVACLQHDSAYLYDPTKEDGDPSHRQLVPITRAEAYRADITYGTNNEFGFDYLRDNMAVDPGMIVQRELNYAIVDEVDNILIDEARTPLIISGPAQEPVQLYSTFARLVPRLDESNYTIDDRTRTVSLTTSGIARMEQWAKVGNLYDPENYHLVHYIENALTAHVLRKRDRDYVVDNGEVVIVDEFTGRKQPGRRWSDGLHQAVEAKEGLKVQRESITYATITLQNYFRIYRKLAGMTGTAATEGEEFFKIYRLEVVTIPTHNPMVRQELPDLIYKTKEGKWSAVAEEIKEHHESQRPVLVGTTSIEDSEKLSALLTGRGVPHEVLNAKQHEREAQIVGQAGRPGAVTVATNMAGRGTDIVLGGNPEGLKVSNDEWERDHDLVLSMGGLHVIGTDHHEARRIDNQLRGRSGRQGDPGSSRFYASLEDDLMTRFGGDRIKSMMNLVGMDDETPIENRIVTKSLESAQVKVEGRHFEVRKHLLEYDDVLNNQRTVIYAQRREALTGTDLKANILSLVEEEINSLVSRYLPGREAQDWEIEPFLEELRTIFPLPSALSSPDDVAAMKRDRINETLLAHSREMYQAREVEMGEENLRTLERLLMLRTVDVHWVQHLTATDNLRQGIGLHAYGQRDPLVAYRTEGSRMFRSLMERIRHDIVHSIYKVSPTNGQGRRSSNGVGDSPMGAVAGRRREAVAAGSKKVGRNSPCPCGSGKKYKRCHGSNV
ncbi:MAG: preprotein translocase subunit SecA [Dehalococcoidia bacterium]|nr:preprotein translocase subunit SecA [Dehalococcoidia bacterium]